jgi:hypothetical protein
MTKDEAVLRLKYAKGLTYAQIAKAMNLSEEDVLHILLRAAKVGSDKHQVLAFVHGELDQSATQKFAARIEAEEALRKDFETVLAASDELEQKYSKSTQQVEELMSKTPEKETGDKASRRPFYIAGAVAVVAIALAFVFLKGGSSHEEAVPPANEAVQGLDAPVEQPVPDALPTADEPPPGGEAPAVTEPAPAPDSEPAPEAEASVAPEAVPAPQPPPPPPPKAEKKPEKKAEKKADKKSGKKMAVVAAKTKIGAGLNGKKALAYLRQKIDGKKSCWSGKTLQAAMTVNKDGSVGKIQTTPKNAEAVKCLKQKFAGKSPALKSKAGGKITLQLKTI